MHMSITVVEYIYNSRRNEYVIYCGNRRLRPFIEVRNEDGHHCIETMTIAVGD